MRAPPRDVVFDLDGTLLDPYEGITRSYLYALERLGVPLPPQRDLAICIGPPLRGNFARLLGTDDPVLVERAVSLYRERFDAVGWTENVEYDGALAMLDALRERGVRVHLATAKPLVFTERVVERFGLASRLHSVHAAALDASRDDKAHILRGLVAEVGVDAARAAMVGDRAQDVWAATANGLLAVGVTWGYGSREELTQAGAALLCATPAEVLAALLPA